MSSILAPIFARNPDSVAIRAANVEISYGQFCQDIDTMALWLNQHGVEPGSRLGIRFRGDKSYWTWVVHLAAIRVGTTHVTINSPETLRAAIRLESGGITTYLIDAPEAPGAPPGLNVLPFQPTGVAPLHELLDVEPIAWPEPETEATAARLVFTSGTTGRPQLVLWNPAVFVERIEQVERAMKFSESTRLFSTVGLMAGFGFRFQIPVWRAGGTLLVEGNRGEVDKPSADLLREDSNLLVMSPATLRNQLSSHPERWRGKRGRTLVVGGGRTPVALRDEALKTAAAKIEIQYGATETGWMARGDAKILDRDPGAVGFLTDGVTVEIVDAEERPLPAGEIGTIRVRTGSMAEGYEKVRPRRNEPLRPAAAGPRSSAFRDGWFYPGDLGSLTDDGLLILAGRASDAINIGGVKLSIADIEGTLAQNPALPDICLVPLRLDRGDVLAVVAAVGAGEGPKELEEAIRGALPRGCPFRLVRARHIPRNETGKVRRHALAQRLTQMLEG
jgi:acyl-coenzyme A synthetase/AMP-(fatty) acid ligase